MSRTAVPDAMRNRLDGLRDRLAGPKPGVAAQAAMAPIPRPAGKLWIEAEGSSLRAGVMVLLYPKSGRAHMVFIRRTPAGLHGDQISFPGGQIESGEDAVRAALRETTEEVGAPAERIEVLGTLTPLYISRSNFSVFPVVGALAATPVFKPDPAEVAGIIEVPLDHLRNPGHRRTETRTFEGRDILIPYYGYRRHRIWGATAMILAEFLEIDRGLAD